MTNAVGVGLGRRLVGAGSAQLRVHAREQLLAAERLRDVVVGAGAQAAHLVELLRTGREHQHRDVAQLPDPLECLPAVQAWHRHVEKHEVGLLGVEDPQPLVAVGRLDHAVAGPLEQLAHEAADVRIVVDDEDAAHARPTGSSLVRVNFRPVIRVSYRNPPGFPRGLSMRRSWRV